MYFIIILLFMVINYNKMTPVVNFTTLLLGIGFMNIILGIILFINIFIFLGLCLYFHIII